MKIRFDTLRTPWFWLLLGSLFAVALLLFSLHTLKQVQHQYQSLQQQLSQAQTVLADTRAASQWLPAYTAIYRALQQQVIGQLTPARAQWLESLRPVTLQLQYELLPAHPLPVQADFNPVLHPFYFSARVLHEERLFELFQQLRSQGWLILEHCTVTEAHDPPAQLEVECRGSWLTLSES